MSDTIKFQCNLSTSNSVIPLGFEILLNDKSVFKREHVIDPCQISLDIEDLDAAEQKLQFVMTGKTVEHTKVDDQGNIIEDAMLTIGNVLFDDIDINQLLIEQAEYTHDFNGTQSPIKDNFYGSMGCNGAITFKFTTPFYLWLLENM
jgi:hypothetical protein